MLKRISSAQCALCQLILTMIIIFLLFTQYQQCLHNLNSVFNATASLNNSVEQDSRATNSQSSLVKNSNDQNNLPLVFRTHNWGKVKRILFWTTFFGDPSWSESDEVKHRARCPYNCEFTNDRSLINSSDAVVFHGRDLKTEWTQDGEASIEIPADLPTIRTQNQQWIFFLLESPLNTRDLTPFNDIFNLTMTYREDSNLFTAYGLFVDTPTETHFYENKTKLIAWMVSHCNTPSKRELLVQELQNFVPVDIYGSCGPLSCGTHRMDCFAEFGRTYKFYLALENSLCEDYATEKFFWPFIHNMVPVAYGAGNYTKLAPKGSFIDIESFGSVKNLSDYLLFLDQNPDEYSKYFEWRNKFMVLDEYVVLTYSWCKLCEELTLGVLLNETAKGDLSTWWNFKGDAPVCRQPPSQFK